ncbi:MAG TPA: MFS transporter [Victivallales bacterium]|nr:MFS transporter [Victivallales bacterium]
MKSLAIPFGSGFNFHLAKTKSPGLISLMPLVSLGSFATVFLTPVFPEISKYFNITTAVTQVMMVMLLLGYTVGPIFGAPVANRFGRKKAAYLSVFLYFLGTVLIISGINIHLFIILLIGCFVITMGGGSAMTLAYVIIHDYFSHEQAKIVTSYMMIAFSLIPAFSICITGFLATNFGWESCLYALFAYGFLVLFVILILPETITRINRKSLNLIWIYKKYIRCLKNPRLIIFSLIFGLASSCIYVIPTIAPFISVNMLKITPEEYGLYLLFAYLGQFIGGYTSGKLQTKLSANRLMLTGGSITLTGALIMFILFSMGSVNIISLFGPMFLIMCGTPLIYGATSAKAVLGQKDKSSASAAMLLISMFLISCVSLGIVFLDLQTALFLPGLIFILMFVTIILTIVGNRIYKG